MNQPLLLHIPIGANWETTVSSFKTALRFDAADDAHSMPAVIVLVPAALVPRLAATIPTVSSPKLRHAAASAIEDRLVGDIEAQHVTLVDSHPASGGRLEVEIAAIEKDRLNTLLAALGAAGLKPIAVHADADCIASKPGDVLLWIDGADAHWVTPAGLRRTWPVDALADALDWSLGATPPGTLGLRVYASEVDLQKHAAVLDTLRIRLVSVHLHAMERPLDWLGRELETARPPNLLHGEFAPKPSHTARWQRWRWPWRMAALIVLVLLGQLVLDLTLANSRARAIEQRIAAQASVTPSGQFEHERRGAARASARSHVRPSSFAHTRGVEFFGSACGRNSAETRCDRSAAGASDPPVRERNFRRPRVLASGVVGNRMAGLRAFGSARRPRDRVGAAVTLPSNLRRWFEALQTREQRILRAGLPIIGALLLLGAISWLLDARDAAMQRWHRTVALEPRIAQLASTGSAISTDSALLAGVRTEAGVSTLGITDLPVEQVWDHIAAWERSGGRIQRLQLRRTSDGRVSGEIRGNLGQR